MATSHRKLGQSKPDKVAYQPFSPNSSCMVIAAFNEPSFQPMHHPPLLVAVDANRLDSRTEEGASESRMTPFERTLFCECEQVKAEKDWTWQCEKCHFTWGQNISSWTQARFRSPAELLWYISSAALNDYDKIGFLKTCTLASSIPSPLPHNAGLCHTRSLASTSWLLWDDAARRHTKLIAIKRKRRLPRRYHRNARKGASHDVDVEDDGPASDMPVDAEGYPLWRSLEEQGRQMIDRTQQIRANFTAKLIPTNSLTGIAQRVAYSIKRRMQCEATMTCLATYRLLEVPASYGIGPLSCYLETTCEMRVRLFDHDDEQIWFCGHPDCIGQNGDFLCFSKNTWKWRHDRVVHPPGGKTKALDLGLRIKCSAPGCEYATAREKWSYHRNHFKSAHPDCYDDLERKLIIEKNKPGKLEGDARGAVNTLESTIPLLLANASTPFVSQALQLKLRRAKNEVRKKRRIAFPKDRGQFTNEIDPAAPEYTYIAKYHTPWPSSIVPPSGRRGVKYPGQVNAFLMHSGS